MQVSTSLKLTNQTLSWTKAKTGHPIKTVQSSLSSSSHKCMLEPLGHEDLIIHKGIKQPLSPNANQYIMLYQILSPCCTEYNLIFCFAKWSFIPKSWCSRPCLECHCFDLSLAIHGWIHLSYFYTYTMMFCCYYVYICHAIILLCVMSSTAAIMMMTSFMLLLMMTMDCASLIIN